MFQLFVQYTCKQHIPSSVPGQMGNDSSQDFGEFIILFNGLLKRIFMAQSSYHLHHGNKREPNFMEFSWYTVVIV